MPSSTASTGSNSEIESMKDLLENEEIRYVRKGYGLISAIVITLSFYFLVPELAYPLYLMFPYKDNQLIIALGTFLVHLAVFSIANVTMYFIYHFEIPFFERYKISKEPWPWYKDPQKWNKQLKQTIKVLAFNQLVLMPLLLEIPLVLGIQPFVTDPGEFPTWKSLIPQTVFFMIVEDTLFYWGHRLFHTPAFYRRFHKWHHQYTSTIGIASEYAHPFEFVVCNMLPSSMGPVLFGRCHIFTYWMWIVLRVCETTDGHCGYEFSWSPFRLLPFSGSSNYHNYHHSHNLGNYGSFFTYWDTICKTNTHYWRFLAKQEKSN